jgi:hypothetical protein
VGRGFKQFEAFITGTGTSRTRQLLSLWPMGVEKLLIGRGFSRLQAFAFRHVPKRIPRSLIIVYNKISNFFLTAT